MNDEEITFVDLTAPTESEFTTRHIPDDNAEDEVVDDRRESFRKILKNTGMRVNFDNLTTIFFDHDSEDRQFLVDMLRRKRVPADNIEVIFNSWFGMYPDEAGIDVKGKSPQANSGEENAFSPQDAARRAQDRELKRMQNETDILEAETYHAQARERLDRLHNKGNDGKDSVRERFEPVMTVRDDGKYEVAKDEAGQPITRKIVEPVAQAGNGQSDMMTNMMFQKVFSDNGNNNSRDDTMMQMRIQSLESEIARSKDTHEAALERQRDRLAEKDNEISRIREDNRMVVDRLRDDYAKEIKALNEKHTDKIDIITQRHEDMLSHKEDMWESREQSYVDKVGRIEQDANYQIGGLRAKHEDDLIRMNSDHKLDVHNFESRARDNLENLKLNYNTGLSHRDQMEHIKEENREKQAELEKRIDSAKNTTDAERQNDKIIEAVGGTVKQVIEIFGKPTAANMETAALLNKQQANEIAIMQRQRSVEDMRARGYGDEEIDFVMQQPPLVHDDTYEQMLDINGMDSMDGMDEHDGMVTLESPVPPEVVSEPPAKSGGFVRSIR